MKISVIIPTYKPQSYLWDCLDSIKNQTFNYNDFELLIILNGCNEPYSSSIKSFIESQLNELNVNFIQIDKGGVSNARNIALDNAKGEYITFIDDDDYISPCYLEELYKIADESTIALSNTEAVYDIKNVIDNSDAISNTFKFLSPKGKQKFYKAKKYFSGPCMKLIHKEIIKERRFDANFTVGEDSQFMFLISDRIKYVDFTSSNAIYYRRVRAGSAMSSFSYMDKVRNLNKTIPSYTKIFLKGFPNYNFYFYLTRILGALHSLL